MVRALNLRTAVDRVAPCGSRRQKRYRCLTAGAGNIYAGSLCGALVLLTLGVFGLPAPMWSEDSLLLL